MSSSYSTIEDRIVHLHDSEILVEREVWEDGVFVIYIMDEYGNELASHAGTIPPHADSEDYLREVEADLIGSVD